MYMYTYTCTCTCICIHVHVHVYVHVYIMYMYMYMYMYTCSLIHARHICIIDIHETITALEWLSVHFRQCTCTGIVPIHVHVLIHA